jgi:Ran GTPase-activating protein (RanGAP) involved in mRNA processing and transport
MPQLQRRSAGLLSGSSESVSDRVRSLQHRLGSNRNLKILDLYHSHLGNEGIRLIADALVGTTTTIEILNVSSNEITSNSLDDITRILESSSQVKHINVQYNSDGIFDDEDATRRFAQVLSRKEFLKELYLSHCRLRDGGIRLIAQGLVGNVTIKVLNISFNAITSNGLADIALLLELTRLQTFDLSGNRGVLGNDASMQRFADALSTCQEFLQKLNLKGCELGDGGFHLIANSLTGNRIMKYLNIRYNRITSLGLADITRLLEATHLETIVLWENQDSRGIRTMFHNEEATRHFVQTLQQKRSSVQEIELSPHDFPVNHARETTSSIKNTLMRNRQLNRVAALLAPPSPPPQQQQQQHQQPRDDRTAPSSSMMLKTWHKAITKFAKVPNNAGASAVFHLLTARPQLLEQRRIKRPAPVVAVVAATAAATTTAPAVSQEQKRRRV